MSLLSKSLIAAQGSQKVLSADFARLAGRRKEAYVIVPLFGQDGRVQSTRDRLHLLVRQATITITIGKNPRIRTHSESCRATFNHVRNVHTVSNFIFILIDWTIVVVVVVVVVVTCSVSGSACSSSKLSSTLLQSIALSQGSQYRAQQQQQQQELPTRVERFD